VKVVVVGAGIVGASAALRLAQRGAAVTVVDAGDPGGGTSSTSFAWTNAGGKRPKAYFDLNVAGMAAYRRLWAEWGRVPGLHLTGHVEWAAPDDADGWRLLDRKLGELGAWGYPALRLPTARLLRELEPDLCLDPRVLPEVVFYPDEGHVDPPVLIGHLLRAAGELGATVRTQDRVVAIEATGGRVAAVALASGTRLPADAVVSCCGRWTNDVARLVGAAVPLVSPEPQGSPAVGLLALTSPVAAQVRRVISSPGLNLRPAGGGRLLLQDVALDGSVRHDAVVEPPAAAALLVRLRRLVRYTAGARLEGARVGIRALPADGRSVVGWVGEVAGFYVIVTHSGVTLGPLLGELAAQEVVDGDPAPLLAPFRPQRFDPPAGGP
jgi:glycine/D-amino acid oxidase-like deaminating enzyme